MVVWRRRRRQRRGGRVVTCITRGADFLRSMCTHWSDASSVGTYCEPRWPPSAWSSVCTSYDESADSCSSCLSAASAFCAASRISSSACESDASTALSTCAQNGSSWSRPCWTKAWSHVIAVSRVNLSCEPECCTSTCTAGAYLIVSTSRISRRNSERTEYVCWRISLFGSASMWKRPSKKTGRCVSISMSGTESRAEIHPTRNWRENGLVT